AGGESSHRMERRHGVVAQAPCAGAQLGASSRGVCLWDRTHANGTIEYIDPSIVEELSPCTLLGISLSTSSRRLELRAYIAFPARVTSMFSTGFLTRKSPMSLRGTK